MSYNYSSNGKNIMILGAMELELAHIKISENLQVIKTGVGKKRLKLCIEKKLKPYLNNQKIDLAINIGFAGSLDKNIVKNTVVLPKRITHHSLKETLHVDLSKWHDLFSTNNFSDKKKFNIGGHLLTVDYIFDKKDKKNLEGMEDKYHYVDMESYWICHFMQKMGVPFLVMRCILDDYNFNFPPIKFLKEKWPSKLKKEALFYFPRHPIDFINLLRLHFYEIKAIKLNTKALFLFLKQC